MGVWVIEGRGLGDLARDGSENPLCRATFAPDAKARVLFLECVVFLSSLGGRVIRAKRSLAVAGTPGPPHLAVSIFDVPGKPHVVQ